MMKIIVKDKFCHENSLQYIEGDTKYDPNIYETYSLLIEYFFYSKNDISDIYMYISLMFSCTLIISDRQGFLQMMTGFSELKKKHGEFVALTVRACHPSSLTSWIAVTGS